MIKLVTLLWRRPGLSREAFESHYEANHRRIGEKVLGGYATHYVRRYADPFGSESRPEDPDVVMEIWFPDQARIEAFFASIADPAIMDEIVADEEYLFDRTRMRGFTVREQESELPPLAS